MEKKNDNLFQKSSSTDHETTPLLHSNKFYQKDTSFQTTRVIIVCVSLILYMFSFIGFYYMASQYNYVALQRQFFPNMSVEEKDTNDSSCANRTVTKDQIDLQKLGANLNIYVVLVSIPSIFTNIIYGTYGDLVGRKMVFLVTNVGSFIKCGIFFFLILSEISIYYGLIAFAIESVMGGFVAMIQAACAYVADITAANKSRSFAIAMVELSLGIGTALGSFSIGFMIKYISYKWTCLVLTCGFIMNIILIVILIPETIDRSKTIPLGLRPNVLQQLGTSISFYIEPHPDRQRWRYNVCIIAFLFSCFAVFGRSSVETLVQLGAPFCWNSVKVAYFTTIRGVAQNTLAMGGIKIMHKCLGDVAIAVLGCISGISSLIMEAFVENDMTFYLVPVVGIGSIITMPMIRSIMSRMTPVDKQGAIFASIAAIEAVGNVVSNLTTSIIYSKTVGTMRGLVFLYLAGTTLICLLFMLSLKIVPKLCEKKNIQFMKTISVPDVKQGID